jgi:pimeloyl-ACP methyl ester carboxylesterase
MDPTTFTASDGARLSVRTLGAGRPVLMLHGFLANAKINFFGPGIAGALADSGHRVIAPDMRGHGRSAQADDPALFPRDVLARDGLELAAHFDLADYDLVGYSMGASAAVRMLVRGARPRRCVLGGMGGLGVLDPNIRIEYFKRALAVPPTGEPSRMHDLLRWSGADPRQMLLVLDTQPPTTREDLARIEIPVLVLSGETDADNGSAEELAALLPNARAQRTPGDHGSAVAAPEFAAAIQDFLV